MILFDKISEIIKYVSKNRRVYIYDAQSFSKDYRAELHRQGIMFSKDINKASVILCYLNKLESMKPFMIFCKNHRFFLSENLIIWIKNISALQFNNLEEYIFSTFYFKHPLYHTYCGIFNLENVADDIRIYSKNFRMNLSEHFYYDIGRMNNCYANIKCLAVSMALDYIRIGDTVLNYNASLGYESYVLGYSSAHVVTGVIKNKNYSKYANRIYSNNKVSFVEHDPLNNNWVDVDENDFIYARLDRDDYGSIELLLENFHTLLKPSGRLMLLLIETEYDKCFSKVVDNVYSFLCSYFCLEWCWDFHNVGNYISTIKHYCIEEIDVNDCFAILMMGMKNPLYGIECDYDESTWKDENGLANFIDFKKFYKNPYLIKGFQSYGKLENKDLCKQIAHYIIKVYDKQGPEYGGALCYLGYRLIEQKNNTTQVINTLKINILEYLKIKGNNPHVLRWKISLCYMLGILLLKEEQYDESIVFFKKCISYNALEFSPALGTKVFGAYRQLGLLSESNEERHKWYREALTLVPKYFSTSKWRDIISNLKTPIPTGFEDMSNILDICKNMAWDLMYVGNTYNSRYMCIDSSVNIREDKIDLEEQLKLRELEDEIEILKEEKRNLDFLNQQLQKENNQILSSRSWKMTKPLRYIGRYVKQLKKDILFDRVCELVRNNKFRSICIFSPMYNSENLKDGYYRRVHEVDEILWDFIKIHINDVNFDNNKLRIEFFENDVINISYCPSNILQLKKVKLLLKLSGKMYTHSLWQMKDWALNMEGILKILDIHGAQPEESVLYGDIDGAKKISEKERIAVQKVDYMISVTHSMQEHMIRKYGSLIKAKFILMPIYENRFSRQQGLTVKQLINGCSIVIYAGGTQKWQMIPEMQSAMRNTKNNVFFEICVPAPEEFMKIWGSKTKLLSNMNVRSRSHEDVMNLYDRCHYGFVLRDDIVVNNVACPTKLIEYIEHDIIPILSTTHIGDFSNMGMRYILVDDFIEGRLPEESKRAEMAINNRQILEVFKQEYKEGSKRLLEVIENNEYSEN